MDGFNGGSQGAIAPMHALALPRAASPFIFRTYSRVPFLSACLLVLLLYQIYNYVMYINVTLRKTMAKTNRLIGR